MGHGLETDIGPRREGEELKGLEGRAHLRQERRLQLGKTALKARMQMDKAPDNARGQRQGEHDVQGSGKSAPQQAQESQDHGCRGCAQHLAKIDFVACKGVVEAEAHHVAEEDAHKHGKRRAVRPDDGCIHKPEKPSAEEGMVVAHHVADIGIGSGAAVGMPCGEKAVVAADNHHGKHAEDEAHARAHRPSHGKKDRGGHDEGAPPNAAAEGHGPQGQGGETFLRTGICHGNLLRLACASASQVYLHLCNLQRGQKWLPATIPRALPPCFRDRGARLTA